MLDKKTAAIVIVLELAFFSVAAVVGTIDYVFGVKNKPEFDVRTYVWTRTNGSGASGTLTPAGSHTATLTPCPNGISSASVGVASFRLYGGSGTAETPLITSFSAAGANCTIGFTAMNVHTGSWVLGPNGGGIQEAAMDAAGTGKTVRLQATTYPVYAPIYIPGGVTVAGLGFESNIQGQYPGIGVLNAESGGAVAASIQFQDLQISSVLPQTTGAYGVRIGYSTGATTPMFTHVYFLQLWDSILGGSMNQLHVTDCTFYEMGHVGVVAQDTACPDCGGPRITSSVFLNYNTSGAEAGILINSSAEHMISNNTLDGASLIKWFVEYKSTTSGGWLNISNNKCETTTMGCVSISGYADQVVITGNTMGNSGSAAGWNGVYLNGSSGGIKHVSITGNPIQCNGAATTNGMSFWGTYSNLVAMSNELDGCNFGINANGTPTNVRLGPNQITNTTGNPMFAASSQVVVDDVTGLTYAQIVSTTAGIGNAGNGSRTFCLDCNLLCTLGGSTGRSCVKENGAWTH